MTFHSAGQNGRNVMTMYLLHPQEPTFHWKERKKREKEKNCIDVYAFCTGKLDEQSIEAKFCTVISR